MEENEDNRSIFRYTYDLMFHERLETRRIRQKDLSEISRFLQSFSSRCCWEVHMKLEKNGKGFRSLSFSEILRAILCVCLGDLRIWWSSISCRDYFLFFELIPWFGRIFEDFGDDGFLVDSDFWVMVSLRNNFYMRCKPYICYLPQFREFLENSELLKITIW